MQRRGWIGVDLDGTLAQYHRWHGIEHVGAPVPAMVTRVRRWLAEGQEVRIMTARVSGDDRAAAVPPIQAWCLEHLGQALPVTCRKDFGMLELWDDRCVQIEPNTGRRMDGVPDGPPTP